MFSYNGQRKLSSYPGAPLKINGAPENIQSNLTGMDRMKWRYKFANYVKVSHQIAKHIMSRLVLATFSHMMKYSYLAAILNYKQHTPHTCRCQARHENVVTYVKTFSALQALCGGILESPMDSLQKG